MISAGNKDEIVRFYTVTDPTTHKKGYTVYKVTARIISRNNPEDIQEHGKDIVISKSSIRTFGRFIETFVGSQSSSLRSPKLKSLGGEVQDGSELIGPAEPFSKFLADSLLDGGSEGVSSDSELNSLDVDGDSVVASDDGMTSGSIRHSSPSGATLSLSPKSCTEKQDYLEKASEQIALAVQKELEQEFAVAFSYYQKGVDLLLQGVQGEASPSRREAVKRKTAEYLMRAELISEQLKDGMGQSSTQSTALGSQCCGSSWIEQTYSDELKHYRVLGVIDKVLLVMDKRTQETFILKTIVPRSLPNMVQLEKYIVSEDSIFLLLQYAEGGKLWTHICKYLQGSSPDESLNIPFIQKVHSTPITTNQNPTPTCSSSVESHGLEEIPFAAQLPDSGATSEEECTNSYLTLCNEYEQEKLDPEEDPCLFNLQKQSVLTTDSQCTTQDLCLFSEEEQPSSFMDQCSLSPDSLNESPVEMCQSDRSYVDELFVASDACAEVTEEPLEALWRSDDGAEKCSNQLVPVISFKEAVLEDATVSCVEGQPPDLLVNLPALEGDTVETAEEEIAGGVTCNLAAKTSPTFSGPDVLQRGETADTDLSLVMPSLSLLHAASEDVTLSLVVQGVDVERTHVAFVEDDNATTGSGGGAPRGQEVEDVSKFFQELDKLAAVSLDTRIPEALVRSWAADMVVALDALHQEGIICRDLNPSNILLNHTGRVQLTYFCSWSDVEESCDPEAISKMYCAPEVGGIGEETLACDWWSLGALLFELIVGKSLLQCHPAGISRHSSLNIPEFVSKEASSLLEQLLQYNPVERLGAGGAGVEDIKSHPFFSHVNWTR
ncbi:hypothetical protein DNTS_035819 [Danionella cerebrum]|uniref:Protein kinase domain-containing protein n=1 Tax=Danionella cerebrum TaxID=2873325 RepID=A0A553Q3G1_9TELE|nr:hypothetical protein DNTS_035819 [Danionella translucida]